MVPSDGINPDAPMPPSWVTQAIRGGIVIPAHPLALDPDGNFDQRSQRALTRYYHAAGAGGLAVGVHTTQFHIRAPQHNLLRPVLSLAAETARELDAASDRQTVLIAGICGPTDQAVLEAELARDLGYHIGLLSLAALPDASDDQLIRHCQAVARRIPIFGFYLQPAVGGRILSLDFWRRLAGLPNLVGIKISPFDRYKTLDVVRAVAEARRGNDVALYTGNDDTIVIDLLTDYEIRMNGYAKRLQIVGGLLGHWACWTQKAVELLQTCKSARQSDQMQRGLLTLAAQVTDCNAALFDAAGGFAGCIAGIQEVLFRQGLLRSPRCLDPDERLSPGQREEIDRVYNAYPHLTDDEFVTRNLDAWLR
ncbi:Dihydrodipicolinate synthetase family protein [Stieleria maiorica]|uniref:Dihydrodipicolinate synthetase family protein n=2 Tax=Stieleria maiorica TaxID=2795974 RepID=A0A5B9M8V3_9BACT|nr:Dihydrodipicolinate synthetase family protein [Stieleria maiorica]